MAFIKTPELQENILCNLRAYLGRADGVVRYFRRKPAVGYVAEIYLKNLIAMGYL